MFLGIVLSAIAGCSIIEKPKTEAVDKVPALAAELSVPAGPVVASLMDGRTGFIITETPSMDTESRRDFEQAIVMMKNQDFEKAIELLEKVIERSPGVTAPYVDIAIAYKQIEQLEQAEKHLKTALELVPEHPVASNEYGLLLRKAGRFAEARTIYEKTLAVFPDYHPARRNLGILCDLYLNDQACALEQYEIYCEAMPKDEQAKMWVADLRARLKR
jgi:Tfp pilus assembly protein PilF